MFGRLDDSDRIAETIRRNDWREELTALDRDASRRLLEGYQRMIPRLRQAADDLRRGMDAVYQETGQFDFDGMRQVREYNLFQTAVRAEMDDFAQILARTMDDGNSAAIRAGLDAAERMAEASGGRVIAGIWNRPDPEAVRRAIGYMDGAAMRDNLAMFGENATQTISYLIIAGVAQGKSPYLIGQIISEWENVPYHWAQTMARTGQIYSARAATHIAYRENERVVQGWMWLSALDRRTCISCWSKHGQKFDNSQTLNDHHQGRCVAAPIVRGSTWHENYRTGPERFADLDEDDQRAIFNNNKLFEAWQRGNVDWSRMSVRYANPVYGDMQRATSYVETLRRR